MNYFKKNNFKTQSLITDKLGVSLEELKKIRALNDSSHAILDDITEQVISHSRIKKSL